MASNSHSPIPTSPITMDERVPSPRLYPPGPPSVISSRMTDIASEDGDASPRSPQKTGRATESQPSTGQTGTSRGAPWSQSLPLRRGMQRSSVSGSIGSSRPLSAASRSHAPIASHAFFRPMSSQKLQAQRGAPRPPSVGQHRLSVDYLPDEDDQSHIAPGDTATPRSAAHINQPTYERLEEAQPPPSRDTEMTETYDRVTTTTSPTHGNYPATSVADSTRPLHQQQAEEKGLSLNLESSNYRNASNSPSPMKSPRSFRSSLFMSGMGESTSKAANRNMHGAEKLSSGASSPQLTPRPPQSAQSDATQPKPPPRLGRNHEYFEGNTVFCIGGRLQNTRHRPINIGTGFLIVLPAALFFGGCASYLWHNLSPAIPVVFAYLFFITLSSFVRASASDPGILPRNLHQFPPVDENEDPLRLAPPTNDWTLIKSAELSIAAMEVPTKFCKTCNIWRPPRAHHCRLCDNCIETQDHHCVWINNCVGRRNYRYFFTFVTTATIMGLYLIGACLAQIIIFMQREKVSFGQAVDHSRMALALVVYGVLALLYPIALCGYHLFLMARGETTREFLNSHKLLRKDRYRAFNQASMWRNWVVVLCRPRPPTYYRFKDRYQEGDQRFGERRYHLRSESGRRVDSTQDVEMHSVRPFQGPVSLRNEGTAAAAAAVPV